MKTFIIVIKNKFGDIVLFKTKAPHKPILYNPDKSVSMYLSNKMVRDTYLFGGYSKEQIKNCKVIIVEENLIEI